MNRSFATFSMTGLLALLASTGLFPACDKVSNVVGADDRQSLSDSTISPRVIFTSPSHGTSGPFQLYNYGPGSQRPHFVIQFNKFISTYSIGPNTVRISGFERPAVVRVRPQGFYYRLDKTAYYSDILEFDVVDSLGYYYRMPYEVGHTYTVVVDTSLRDINNNLMGEAYVFSFAPEPNLRILMIYPDPAAGKLSVTQNQFPSVLFNSKMTSSLFSSISFSPPLSGLWNLSYDSAYVSFSPSNPLSFSTQYTVTIPQGTADRDGHGLPQSFQAVYTTHPFMILSASPPHGSVEVPPWTSVYFQVTGRIDVNTVVGAVTVSPSIAYSISAYENSFYLYLDSPARFATGTTYTITISSGLKASDGTSLVPYIHQFTTEPFEVNYTSPSNGQTGVYRYTSINVQCNDAIDQSTISSSLTISPTVAGTISMTYDETGFYFSPTNGFAANTTYTVTVAASLKSTRGVAIESPRIFSFTTGS